MENKSQYVNIPAELKSQLPIFQVLGDHLPSQLQTPEAKKTISGIFFWALILGGAFAFFKFLPIMLEYAAKSILLVIFSIVLITLLLLAPKIISLLHRLGTLLLFKGEKAMIRANPVETLQLLSKDAKETLKRVKDKITNVDGVRIDMIQSGETAQKTAEEKYTYAKRFTVEAANLDEKSKQEQANNNGEKANEYVRDAKETRTKAFLLGKEGEAEEQNARSYEKQRAHEDPEERNESNSPKSWFACQTPLHLQDAFSRGVVRNVAASIGSWLTAA